MKIQQLVLLLELFKKKPRTEQQRLAWNMFYAFFELFGPVSINSMIDDLNGIAQQQSKFKLKEKEKLILMAFCNYMKLLMDLLYSEIELRMKEKNFPAGTEPSEKHPL